MEDEQNLSKKPTPGQCTALAQKRKADTLEKMRIYKRRRRSNPVYRAAENVERLGRHQAKATEKATQPIDDLIDYFRQHTARGPIYVCVCCDRLCYRHAVVRADKTLAIDSNMIRKCAIGVQTAEGEKWLCFTCNNALKDGRMPAMALVNDNKFPDKPSHLNLHQLEWRLLAPRLVFMKIHRAPSGGQFKIEGNVVNVIANVANCVNSLPRLENNTDTIPAKLKRRLTYDSYTLSQNVRPAKVQQAAIWLTENGPLYQDQGINFNPKWAKQFRKRKKQRQKQHSKVTKNSNIKGSRANSEAGKGRTTHHYYRCEFKDCDYFETGKNKAVNHLRFAHNAVFWTAASRTSSSDVLVTLHKQRKKRMNELGQSWCSICEAFATAGQSGQEHMLNYHDTLPVELSKAVHKNTQPEEKVWGYTEILSQNITRMRPTTTCRRTHPMSILQVPTLLEMNDLLDAPDSEDSEDETAAAGVTDTMLSQNTYIENTEFGAIHNFAPGAGNKPKSIFLDKFCEELAYPDIFLGHQRKINRTVKINYSEVVKSELLQTDRRAATNVENIFFKTKKIQMKLLTGRTQLALRQHKTSNLTLTAGDIKVGSNVKKIIQFDQGYKFLATLRGSPPYFEKAKRDIFAMIRQLGPATFFVSLSAAETRWLHLLRILGQTVDKVTYTDYELEHMSWPEKSRLIQADPITCARHFDHTLRVFISHFLKSPQAPIGKLQDFFYRVEMQNRGSCHVHMLIWIEQAPKLENNEIPEVVQFIDKYVTCSKPSQDNLEMTELVSRQMHKHTITCRPNSTSKCRFSYPQPPLPETKILEPLTRIDENYKENLELWKKVQAHMEDLDQTVAVPFPKFLAQLGLTEDEYTMCLRAGIKQRTIFLKRATNEITINNYNHNCLKAWRANMDIQFILDPYACATYIVSYMSKGCRGMSQLLRQVSKEASRGNTTLVEQMRHIGNKFLNAVEISAQEAAYIALQLSLRRSSRSTVYLNTGLPHERVRLLKTCQEIENMDDEDTNIDSSNILDRYSSREKGLERTCLAEWAAWYDCKRFKPKDTPTENDEDGTPPEIDLQHDMDNDEDIPLMHEDEIDKPRMRRKRARILRCPWFSVAQDSEKHYRELVMLFVPWRDEKKDLIAGHESYHARFLEKKEEILNLLEQFSPGRSAVEEAAIAIATMEPDAAENAAVAQAAQHDNEFDPEDIQQTNDPTFVPHYDIGQDMDINIMTMPNLEELQHNRMGDQEFRETVQMLNPEQKIIFDYINTHIQTNTGQLQLFLSGGAGVGKTLSTKAIYQQLLRLYNRHAGDDPEFLKVLVMAPTGKAAHLIQGSTIHSALSAPFNNHTDQYIPLSLSNLNTVRTKLSQVKFIIIDEISMVGNKLFNFVDRRMQDIMGIPLPFGGVHVLCVGDLYQLRPVGDRWLFLKSEEGSGPLTPNLWQLNFKLFELTRIMRQKDHLAFAELLNRLREGKHTEKDKAYLRTKTINLDFASPNYPHKLVTHLYNRNKDVDAFNHAARIGTPLTIIAMDRITGATSPSMEEAHLNKLKTKPVKETMGLTTTLTLALEERIEVCINIDISDGLTNGAAGKIMGLPGANEQNMCKAAGIMWIHFDDRCVGRKTRASKRELYTNKTPRTWTPIGPIKKQLNISQKSTLKAIRVQFPVRSAAAKTIHRCQGQTLDAVVADFTATQGPHKHYVAISRVSDPNNLYITNLNEGKITTDKDVDAEMARLRSSALLNIPKLLQHNKPCEETYIAYFNIRSLNKYNSDLAKDYTHTRSLITCLTETHLKPTSRLELKSETHPYQTHLKQATPEYVVGAKHGISIFSKVPIQNIRKTKTDTMEAVTFDVHIPRNMTIVALYRYGKTQTQRFLTDLQNTINQCKFTTKYIGGDMNLNFLNKAIAHRVEQCLLRPNSLKQMIKTKTTIYGSLLDHIYTNEPGSHGDVVISYFSDHHFTRITLP